MTYQALLKELKSGKYHPVYLLHGEESYFIDQIAKYIETHALSEAEKSFNLTTFYGKDADFKSVVDAARRFPMMAERQVVFLREAQDMRELQELKSYADNPMPSTILVITHKHKKLNMNSGLARSLKKSAVIFESKKLYDNKIPGWIREQVQAAGLTIGNKACMLMAEYLGADLAKVANEIEKLSINLPAGSDVTSEVVEKQIGISKDYNVFELNKALGEGNILKANRIVNYFGANPKSNHPVMVIGALFGYFQKIFLFHGLKSEPDAEIAKRLGVPPFFLREYKVAARNYPRSRTESVLHTLKEYDLKSKGLDFQHTGRWEGELLRELVWKILH